MHSTDIFRGHQGPREAAARVRRGTPTGKVLKHTLRAYSVGSSMAAPAQVSWLSSE